MGYLPNIAGSTKCGGACVKFSAWNTSALLWWAAWNANFTFIHLPRTAGQSTETLDAKATIVKTKANRDVSSNRSKPLALGGACCRGNSVLYVSFWHWTPDRMLKCGVPSSVNPYLRPRETYCTVRDPVDRFQSVFLAAWVTRSTHGHWPPSCPFTASAADQIVCFLDYARSTLAALGASRSCPESSDGSVGFFAPRTQPPMSELILHLQPQSHYVYDSCGRRTCDLVFTFDQVVQAGIPHVDGNRAALRTRALASAFKNNESVSRFVRDLYHDDDRLHQEAKQVSSPIGLDRASLLDRARTQFPHFFRSRPVCAASESEACTCAGCCYDPKLPRVSPKYAANAQLRQAYHCIRCVISSAECGGVGPQPVYQVPRSLGGLCRTRRFLNAASPGYRRECNVCDACCDKKGVDMSGPSCLACEAERCNPGVNQTHLPPFPPALPEPLRSKRRAVKSIAAGTQGSLSLARMSREFRQRHVNGTQDFSSDDAAMLKGLQKEEADLEHRLSVVRAWRDELMRLRRAT